MLRVVYVRLPDAFVNNSCRSLPLPASSFCYSRRIGRYLIWRSYTLRTMVNARPRAATASYLIDTLPQVLPPIFEQAQHTTANHRKNLVALRKVQETCATITEKTSKGTKLVGEKAFNTLFVDMVNRVLAVKKGVSVADRVVKFVAQYVSYVTEQGESRSIMDPSIEAECRRQRRRGGGHRIDPFRGQTAQASLVRDGGQG